MLCSYRFYVRPQRIATPPSRAVITVRREQAPSPPPAEQAPCAVIVDTPPHVAIVRQYAW